MDWRISRAIADELVSEAASRSGVEICGLLFGDDGAVDRAVACRNVADDPACAFEIDPAMLIAAHKAARHGGPRIAGCYHSHPNGSPTPSACDRATAFAGLWIIIAAGKLHAWQGDGTGSFTPVALSTG